MNSRVFPALFVGHGSPMNILADNAYTHDLKKTGLMLPEPSAILVISAHWLTKGTLVTGSFQPEQIYDFYGFPKELYEVIYRAPGARGIAKMIVDTTGDDSIRIHEKRGVDHAAWAVLKHMYPEQRLPVLELSLDVEKGWREHFDLGKRLKALRSQGMLIIGSGNIVHNLGDFAWEESAPHYPWAVEFDELIKKALVEGDIETLLDRRRMGHQATRAIPTDEHYLPLLYIMAMLDESESLSFIHESMQNGSISMRCFQIA